jgi:hypothetical protein
MSWFFITNEVVCKTKLRWENIKNLDPLRPISAFKKILFIQTLKLSHSTPNSYPQDNDP